MNVASKLHTMIRHPQYLAIHKNGGSATELELMLQIDEVSKATFLAYTDSTLVHKISVALITDTYIRISFN